MPTSTSNAPLTFELVVEINKFLTAHGLTRERFLDALNDFLPVKRRIKKTHAGVVQINRWLNPTGNHWVEPLGEITLAMELALKKLQEKY